MTRLLFLAMLATLCGACGAAPSISIDREVDMTARALRTNIPRYQVEEVINQAAATIPTGCRMPNDELLVERRSIAIVVLDVQGDGTRAVALSAKEDDWSSPQTGLFCLERGPNNKLVCEFSSNSMVQRLTQQVDGYYKVEFHSEEPATYSCRNVAGALLCTNMFCDIRDASPSTTTDLTARDPLPDVTENRSYKIMHSLTAQDFGPKCLTEDTERFAKPEVQHLLIVKVEGIIYPHVLHTNKAGDTKWPTSGRYCEEKSGLLRCYFNEESCHGFQTMDEQPNGSFHLNYGMGCSYKDRVIPYSCKRVGGGDAKFCTATSCR
ncbi:MAG: hypothetical protein HOE53_02295 [Candidatus Magasanikbacteria bacterium]|jgi:hypothetical protein|nr:hypothetical protein [Candidatus Magasanikbacteria bacterium]